MQLPNNSENIPCLPKMQNNNEMNFPKPCLDCGQLSSQTRCPAHEQRIKALNEARRQATKKATGQYSGDYKARAKQVRDTAIICHLCGETAKHNDPWEADHLYPGQANSPLLPAHRSCNQHRSNKPLT